MSALPPSSPSAPAGVGAVLRQRWAALGERERLVVGGLGAFLAVVMVWLVAVAPALRTLAQAPVQRQQLDAQALQMQALATEAAELASFAPVPPAQAQQVLKSATDQLGAKARLQVNGDRATLTLTNATGEDLRQWLQQARGGARARPAEMTLTRSESGYSGTLVVALPSP